MKNAYNILVGRPERKRLLGRPRHRWEDNMGMDLKEIGWEGVDWIHLAQDRDQWRADVNMVMCLQVLQKPGNFSTVSFSRTLHHGVSFSGSLCAGYLLTADRLYFYSRFFDLTLTHTHRLVTPLPILRSRH